MHDHVKAKQFIQNFKRYLLLKRALVNEFFRNMEVLDDGRVRVTTRSQAISLRNRAWRKECCLIVKQSARKRVV